MPRTGATRNKKAWGVSLPWPAPGDLRILQDFVNTWDLRTKKETFRTPAELAGWLVSQGLLPAGTELSESDRERAVELREGWRALILAGARVDMKVLERLNRAAKRARVEVRLGPDTIPRIEATSSGLDHVLERLLGIFVNAHIDGLWPRLKLCGNTACRRAFYDDSKTHVRKWCTRRCGDAVRSRAYRRTERYRLLNPLKKR